MIGMGEHQPRGKFAIVTGACSGMGYRYACKLASEGYDIIAVSNRKKEIEEAAGKISSSYGVKAVHLCMDLSEKDSAERLYGFCTENGICPEVIVNNAGIFSHSDLEDSGLPFIDTIIDLHMETPTRIMFYFTPYMARNGGGHILNMSSLAGYISFPGIAMYCSTKSYLMKLSKALWYEFEKYGVSVTAVCPGAVATDLYGLPPRYQKLGIRLGIIARPEKVVDKALKAMFRRKRVVVPYGAMNRFFGFFINSLPPVAVKRAYGLLKPLRKTAGK